jgi:dihydrofolate reductase
MTHDAQISSARLPRIAIVVAMTNDRVIGSRQNLPWHLPEDLQLFKRLTTGGTLIKTFTQTHHPGFKPE